MPKPTPADTIVIVEAERQVVKEQVLSGLRARYLRCKAEWLSQDANDKDTTTWQAQMDEVTAAYVRVEADL